MKKVLTIAGSDSCGGAGIQADIKTMTVHKVYAMSVITALTAQNTTGVYAVLNVSPEFVSKQLDCVFTDIFPDAVKIGMVLDTSIISVIAERLKFYQAKNIVLDPVMVSTSGSELLKDDAVSALISELFSIADIITPNIPEASVLSGIKVKNTDDMLESARKISALSNAAVLLKGGHLKDAADDLFYLNAEALWLKGEKINNPNTHGTGCTLSSAIACNLANGHSLTESARMAKEYITLALKAGLDLGKGRGPLKHFV
jgi:hydroxymethylpyrimidine/phosphomethylpyrimidine kinase